MTKEKKDIVLFEEANVEEFNHDEFGNLTTIIIDGDVWFLGNEVAEALGYTNPSKAMKDHVRDKHKMTVKKKDFNNNESLEFVNQAIWREGDNTPKTLINEPGLYSLIMASKLPGVERFQDWVYEDILPTIRKTGSYELQPKSLEEQAIEVIRGLYDRLDEQALELEEARPKIQFSDAVTNSEDSIPVGEFAKYLRQNGVMVGRNRLFEIFRDEGYTIKAKGAEYNNPTQYSMERGWFKVQKVEVNVEGYTYYETITRITGKGQKYFLNKFLDGTLEV